MGFFLAGQFIQTLYLANSRMTCMYATTLHLLGFGIDILAIDMDFVQFNKFYGINVNV